MEPHERIIVALDVPMLTEDVIKLAGHLAPHVGLFKVGLELLTAAGAPTVVNTLRDFGPGIFFDGKFKDIPNTAAAAARAATRLRVRMLNVHCDGGPRMMRDVVEAVRETAMELNTTLPLVLGVTVLTSLDDCDLATLRIVPASRPEDDVTFELAGENWKVSSLVGNFARLAQECGLDGVIASPHEIALIRKTCRSDFHIVTPGVRPAWAATQDQKRVMTPAEAIRAGADYLVIGRPILKPPPEIGSPVDAAKRITEEIAEALAKPERNPA